MRTWRGEKDWRNVFCHDIIIIIIIIIIVVRVPGARLLEVVERRTRLGGLILNRF